MSRQNNIIVAKDTLEICANRNYQIDSTTFDFTNSINYAISNTVLLNPDVDDVELTDIYNPIIEVCNETTTSASRRLIDSGYSNVVVLNFASGTYPGGGFMSGSNAQEEDICRTSALYPCLLTQPSYYSANKQTDLYYTDNIIYSPKVPFIKNDNYMLVKPVDVSVITSPAPCNRDSSLDDDMLESVFFNRMHKICHVAQMYGHKNIVLGAWGCGAFGNDSLLVASLFKDVVPKYDFQHVCYAVYDVGNPPTTYHTFKDVMSV